MLGEVEYIAHGGEVMYVEAKIGWDRKDEGMFNETMLTHDKETT